MDNTFVGYVNELRLNHAAMLLVTTDSPIIEIEFMRCAVPLGTVLFFWLLMFFCVSKKPVFFSELSYKMTSGNGQLFKKIQI